MSDTIFYHLELKKKKTPQDVFAKMEKSIKKRGVTKNWTYEIEENRMCIDFGDGKSETFVLGFDGMEGGGSCKVAFEVEDPPDENSKGEFQTLIAMLSSVRTLCKEIEVSDDYGVAGELFAAMGYKMKFRELTPDEKARLDRLYQLGFTDYEELLLAIFAEDLALPEDFAWLDVLNPGIKIRFSPFGFESSICETYLYETSILKKSEFLTNCTLKQLYEVEYKNADDTNAAVYAFIMGVGRMFRNYDGMINTAGRGAEIEKYFTEKVLPAMEQTDDYGRCELAYRMMLSIFDYAGFVFVGKEGAPVLRERYDSDLHYLPKYIRTWDDIFMEEQRKRRQANK